MSFPPPQGLEGEQRPELRGPEEPDFAFTESPTASSPPTTATPPWSSAWSSARSASGPIRAAVGDRPWWGCPPLAGGVGPPTKRPNGVRHLLAPYDLSTDRLYGHVNVRKNGRRSRPSCATCAPCTAPVAGGKRGIGAATGPSVRSVVRRCVPSRTHGPDPLGPVAGATRTPVGCRVGTAERRP